MSARPAAFRNVLRSLLLIVLIAAAGCGSTPVAQDITQSQATEIVALLTGRGMNAIAKKETGGRGLYSVQIPSSQYGAAMTFLHERGLPGESRPTVSELLAPQGIIPSSREMEQMRLDYALATQIEEMLGSHPAVAYVRCVVRLNSIKEGQEPTVALVIEERNSAEKLSQEDISGIVQTAVPGVKKENIRMAITSAIADANAGAAAKVQMVKFLWFWQVPESDYSGLALLFSFAVIIVGIAAAGLGYWTCLYHRTREPIETNVPEIFPKSLRLDRVRKDLPE